MRAPQVEEVVRRVLGDTAADPVLATVARPASGPGPGGEGPDDVVARAEVALALHVVLYAGLLDTVPSAAAYAADARDAGRGVVLDHAAVRTVAWPAGALPPGREQVTRILRPLGYRRHASYDLTRLRMTGHAYAHVDAPETVPQWFVSELHPDTFSPGFQDAVSRTLATSCDPLDGPTVERLDRLGVDEALHLHDAVALVDALRDAFGRQHAVVTDRDHDALLAESAEMAWIATEGTTCNHCTDRVDDVAAVAEAERRAGRPIKDTVEVSTSGRVRQTAHRATTVSRRLTTLEGDTVIREVPGSFFEVISRDRLADGTLDLAFDAANATGIFAMTRPADRGAPGAP